MSKNTRFIRLDLWVTIVLQNHIHDTRISTTLLIVSERINFTFEEPLVAVLFFYTMYEIRNDANIRNRGSQTVYFKIYSL